MDNSKTFTINSRKFDKTIHRTWKAQLISETEDLFTFVGIFEKEVKHKQLGIIRRGTVSYEYYWKKKWFNIFRFDHPNGGLRNFYCNINQPPVYRDCILDYIDLDVDVIVWTDFSYEIVDFDEFEANASRFKYSSFLRYKVMESLEEVLKLLAAKSFPFNLYQQSFIL